MCGEHDGLSMMMLFRGSDLIRSAGLGQEWMLTIVETGRRAEDNINDKSAIPDVAVLPVAVRLGGMLDPIDDTMDVSWHVMA